MLRPCRSTHLSCLGDIPTATGVGKQTILAKNNRHVSLILLSNGTLYCCMSICSLFSCIHAHVLGACDHGPPHGRLPDSPRVSRLNVTPPITCFRTAVPAPAKSVNTNDGFVGFDSERLKTGGASTILPPVWDSGERLLKWALPYYRTTSASAKRILQVVVKTLLHARP